MSVALIKLADGNEMPQFGLGTWKVRDEEEYSRAFKVAVQAGYRLFDTAQAYGNEHMLGKAWRREGLKREEIFITTKIAVGHFGHDTAKRTFAESLQRLQTDYVDLLLLHFPVTFLRKNAWKALEELKAEGLVRSIGVSNYTIHHLEEMKSYAKEMPVINQIELHVFLHLPELVQYCREHNITVEAYSPLARMHVTDDPVVQKIADKHSKTYTQIMLRWLIDQGYVTIPKSVTPERIRENIDIFDFELDQEDLDALSKADRDLRVCWSPVHVP